MDVRVRSVGRGCKVRVGTEQEAKLLRERIDQATGVCTPPVPVPQGAGWAFFVKEPADPEAAKRVIESFPEVRLLNEPA